MADVVTREGVYTVRKRSNGRAYVPYSVEIQNRDLMFIYERLSNRDVSVRTIIKFAPDWNREETVDARYLQQRNPRVYSILFPSG